VESKFGESLGNNWAKYKITH